MLAQRLAQTIQKRTVILQLDGIDGRSRLRGIAHVLVAVGLQLFELALEVGDFAGRIAHRAAQVLGRGGCDLLDRFESFRFHHAPPTICPLPAPAPRTASRVASDLRNSAPSLGVRTCPDAGIPSILATAPPPCRSAGPR